jgi:hypothetical protein
VPACAHVLATRVRADFLSPTNHQHQRPNSCLQCSLQGTVSLCLGRLAGYHRLVLKSRVVSFRTSGNDVCLRSQMSTLSGVLNLRHRKQNHSRKPYTAPFSTTTGLRGPLRLHLCGRGRVTRPTRTEEEKPLLAPFACCLSRRWCFSCCCCRCRQRHRYSRTTTSDE